MVRLTEPVIAFSARCLPRGAQRLAALPVLAAVLLLQGVLLMGESGPRAGIFTWGFTTWVFATGRPFWGVGAALARYLVLIYHFFVLLLLAVLITPDAASFDQVSRLVRTLLQPLIRIARGRWPAAAALPLVFTAAMVVLGKIYAAFGWISGEEMSIGRALVDSLVLPLQLATVIVWLIFFRAILSWFDAARRSSGPFVWLELFVEPFLRPFRRLHLVLGRVDLTPLAAIFALLVLRKIAEIVLLELYRTL